MMVHLKILKIYLNKMILNIQKIMGSSAHISKTVDKFNKEFDDPDSINVLLLNSQYFGSGLNLQKANDIILFHHMNKDITKQVVGRAQRPVEIQLLIFGGYVIVMRSMNNLLIK